MRKTLQFIGRAKVQPYIAAAFVLATIDGESAKGGSIASR
jgi:hypothetical protein